MSLLGKNSSFSFLSLIDILSENILMASVQIWILSFEFQEPWSGIEKKMQNYFLKLFQPRLLHKIKSLEFLFWLEPD